MPGTPYHKNTMYTPKKYLKGLEIIMISNYYTELKNKSKLIVVTCAKPNCTNQMGYFSGTGEPRQDRLRVFCERHDQA